MRKLVQYVAHLLIHPIFAPMRIPIIRKVQFILIILQGPRINSQSGQLI